MRVIGMAYRRRHDGDGGSGDGTMITVDYTNYYEQQKEWADGLMRASRHVAFQRPGKDDELTRMANVILDRLSKREPSGTLTIQD
jgi:hypothetical protein